MRSIILVCISSLLGFSCTGISTPDTKSNHSEPADHQPNSAQQGNAFSISTVAYYQGDIASTSAPVRVVGLSLTPQHHAELTTYFTDKSLTTIDTGEWTTLGNGNLGLNLQRIGKEDSSALEFKTDGDKLVYVGSAYGSSGLVLWVKAVPNQ